MNLTATQIIHRAAKNPRSQAGDANNMGDTHNMKSGDGYSSDEVSAFALDQAPAYALPPFPRGGRGGFWSAPAPRWAATMLLLLPLVSRAADTFNTDDLALVRAAEQERIDVMARASRSVVCIFDENRGGGGSGVLITPDGYGLTNFHVVAGMMKTRRGLGGLPDGKLYPLSVLGIDPTGDVAMFRLGGRERFDPAPLGDSDQVRVGNWVFAMGNPFILAEDYTPTATHGIVSGVHRYQFGADNRSLVYTDCIQVDASINPGNSGGPLFNMNAEVIGINGRGSFEVRGRVNVGLGYAISINQIKRFIPGLRAGLLTEHGSLGATTIDLGYRKVVFEKMLEPSVASAAGIEIGDRLLRFAGREIHSSNQFANILGVFPANWPVVVDFQHNDQLISRIVRLERLPVNSKEPFEADENLNQEEVKHVLNATTSVLGHIPITETLKWSGHREGKIRLPLLGNLGDFEVAETSDGHGSYVLRGRGAVPTRRYEYNGRTALMASGDEALSSADPTATAWANLWMATRRAVYAPLDDERLKKWRHLGGDEFDGRVVDLLQFTSNEGPDLRVAVDPQTHLPVRAMWKPTDAPSSERPAVEIELYDYRDVQGTRLPHRIRTYVGGEHRTDDVISRYQVEAP